MFAASGETSNTSINGNGFNRINSSTNINNINLNNSGSNDGNDIELRQLSSDSGQPETNENSRPFTSNACKTDQTPAVHINENASDINDGDNDKERESNGHKTSKDTSSGFTLLPIWSSLKYADEDIDLLESETFDNNVRSRVGSFRRSLRRYNKEDFATSSHDYEKALSGFGMEPEEGNEVGSAPADIREEEDEELPYPEYTRISFHCLKQTSTVRRICLRMITNPGLTNKWFERISMMAILLNCVTLGMYHPCADEVCSRPRCKILQIFDDLIFGFFALEMLIKMTAMGIRGSKGAYLSETWNRLDFFIVIAGAFEYCLDVGNINLSAIRTVRVLRPLRAINRIPSMRILVMLLLDTLPMLGNVLLLCFFVFFIFGIIGVQLWAGLLRQRCFLELPENVTKPDPITSHYQITEVTEKDYICSLEKDHGMHRCRDLPPLKLDDQVCEGEPLPFHNNEPNETWCVNWNKYYTKCKAGDANPFQGAMSFDNVGMAWTAIFLVISLEGWTEIMYYVQDAHSFWDWVYFVLLIVIGSFFMINLCLVVIATQFSETKKREMERMRQERARFQSSSTLGSNTASEPTNCYNAIIKYLAHLGRRAKRKFWRWYKKYKRNQRRKKRCLESKGNNPLSDANLPSGDEPSTFLPTANNKSNEKSAKNHLKSTEQCSLLSVENSCVNAHGHHQTNKHHRHRHRHRHHRHHHHHHNHRHHHHHHHHHHCHRNGGKVALESPSNEELSSDRQPDELQPGEDRLEVHSDTLLTPMPSPRRPPSHLGFTREPHLLFAPKASPELSEFEGSFSDSAVKSASIEKVEEKIICTGNGSRSKLKSSNSKLTNSEKHEEILSRMEPPPTSQSNYGIVRHNVSFRRHCKRHCSAPTLMVGHHFRPFDEDLEDGTRDETKAMLDSDSCCSWDNSDSDYSDGSERKQSCFVNKCCYVGSRVRAALQVIVNHKYFQRFIFLAILFNTLSMGIEYHNQPEELTQAVEISNIIFTAIFACEMVLKLSAMGCYVYISDGFNLFDGIVVVVSMMELMEDRDSGLSVLRTFRLLRILKLVRFMPALKRQLVIMLRTLDNVAVFFALLVLFIFIFSCLGMHLFGGKFCTKAVGNKEPCTCDDLLNPQNVTCVCDRKNFNNFLWALVTVFQILTQEDWNVVLFNGMERTSHWAALYFVVLMTFGNYVLFNLLVAILVEGFSTQEEDKKKSDEDSEESQVKDEKLIYFYDPRDNLEKEIRLLCNPPGALSTSFSAKLEAAAAALGADVIHDGSGNFWLPPLITHTAATPQGSPLGTELGHRFPSSFLHSASSQLALNFQASSIISIDKTPIPFKREMVELLSVPIRSENGVLSSVMKRRSSIKSLMNSRVEMIDSIINVAFPNSRRNSGDGVSGGSSGGSNTGTDGNAGRNSASNGSNQQNLESSGSKKRRESLSRDWKPYRSTTRREEDCKISINEEEQQLADVDSVEDTKDSSGNCAAMSTTGCSNHSRCNGGIPLLALDKAHPLSNQPANDHRHHHHHHHKHDDHHNHHSSHPQPHHHHHNHHHHHRNSTSGCPEERHNSLGYFPSSHGLQMSGTGENDPGTSQASNYGNEKRFSIVHEVKVLSPGNSLSGIFYCSSVISRKNSSGANSCNKSNNSKEGGHSKSGKDWNKHRNRSHTSSFSNLPPIKSEDLLSAFPSLPERKFCVYFKWYDWMSKREDYSLFIFPPDNKLRNQCRVMTEHRGFDYFILLFISLNCITLAMERPIIPPWSIEREILNAANYIFTFVFALEMLLKVIAKGLWYGNDAYFKSGWNVMDGTLVAFSLFDLLLGFIAQKSRRIFGILRVFRLLRSLRPLRVINRTPGLKLVVQTLLSSLRPIGNIVLICCTFFIIFGILGVQLFKGAFYYCEGPDVRNVRNKTDCLADMRNKWVNRKYNFDNLGQALMALFVLSSKDGWVNIMYTGLDAVGVDQQPIENYNEWRLLFFISFLLLVAFFVLNMFVGVVVENFHRCREEQEKEERARRAEKRARKLEKRRRKMREPPYYYGYSDFRLFVHSVVTGKYFDVAISLVIGLNVITMSLEHYQMPRKLDYALKLFNFVFTGVFVCESTMKLYALGVRRYLKDKWNQLDIIIVILSIIGIVLEEMESGLIPINPTIIRVMRVARIARVLKLLKMAKGMRALLKTVTQALPQVGNLGLLFFLLFFIFAALGVELFGRLECDEDHPCQGLSEHAHFQNFGMAFLTLFRVATGDNWNGVMKDTLRDQCDPSSDCLRNCCVSPIIAPLYFVIFVLLAQFVLVNVVVAVLMKHLEESHKNMEEDEDYEIDMEIARELAAEKKALEEAIERKKRDEELRKRKPLLTKVSSLPANFVFRFTENPESASTTTTLEIEGCTKEEENNGSCCNSQQVANINNNYNPLLNTKSGPVIKVEVVDASSSSSNCGFHVVVPPSSNLALNQLQITPSKESSGERKLSNVTIVDEESSALTQCLMPSYPELEPSGPDEASCCESITWTGEGDSLTSLSSASDQTNLCLQESQL